MAHNPRIELGFQRRPSGRIVVIATRAALLAALAAALLAVWIVSIWVALHPTNIF